MIEQGRIDQESLQRDLLENGVPQTAAGIAALTRFITLMVNTTGAITAQDILYRRLRIGELDAALADELVPLVTSIIEDLMRRPTAGRRRRSSRKAE